MVTHSIDKRYDLKRRRSFRRRLRHTAAPAMCKRVTEIAPASRALSSLRSQLPISGQLTPIELHGPCPLSFGPRCCVCRVDIRLVCTRRCPPLSTALCCGAELLTAERELRCGPATGPRGGARRPVPIYTKNGFYLRSPRQRSPEAGGELSWHQSAGSPTLQRPRVPARDATTRSRASARRRAAAPVELHFSPRSLSGTTLRPLPHSDQATRRLTF